MESLAILRGVREVSELAAPPAPATVTQRAFDAAREQSTRHANLPPARRITERLGLPWREVLVIAHAPESTRSHALAAKRPAARSLTPEYAAFALKLVARRLRTTVLTRPAYRSERDEMLRANRARWLHGRQLVLPTDAQIRALAGSWDAALGLAGLEPSELGARRAWVTHKILTQAEVMERFADAYGERPSVMGLRAFARGNGIAMSSEAGRRWLEVVADWGESRRQRGLPAVRFVERRGAPRIARDPAPDFSRDVGAARPGETRFSGKWCCDDACAAVIARYLATLGPEQRSTQAGYQDWARTQPHAPSTSVLHRQGGWEKLRRRAQELTGAPRDARST